MAKGGGRKKIKITDEELQGFKYLKDLRKLFSELKTDGTARDKAGNRQHFFDDHLILLLFYFFNPVITSLRGLQQATQLEKVQRTLGIKRTSLGALSEAGTIFNPELLRDIVQELAAKVLKAEHNLTPQEISDLEGLTAVDGTFLRALPRMMWALWSQDTHTAKMHLHFDVLKGVPVDATITSGKCSETKQLGEMLKSSRLYLCDRGFSDYGLFEKILNANSSFIARVKNNISFTIDHERTLSPEARAAGVTRDFVISRLGASHHRNEVQQPLRVVNVEAYKADGTPYTLWLLTDRMDLDAELVALAYRYRWTIELFFRWFKCVLGCRHLIAESQNGLALQCYAALIASLLITIRTSLRPAKRTWEMIQLYLQGWATVEEFQRHLDERRAAEAKAAKKAAARAAA